MILLQSVLSTILFFVYQQLLDEASESDTKRLAETMSEAERQDKLYELRELRKHWRQTPHRDQQQLTNILKVRGHLLSDTRAAELLIELLSVCMMKCFKNKA